jgi:hypothetical protein
MARPSDAIEKLRAIAEVLAESKNKARDEATRGNAFDEYAFMVGCMGADTAWAAKQIEGVIALLEGA